MTAAWWASFVATKFGAWLVKWLLILGGVLAAAAALAGIAWRKGEKTGAAKGDAEAAKTKAQVAQQQAAISASEQQAERAATQAASEVSNEVQKLPDAPAQQIGSADPSTAAGKLRDWTRD